MSTIVEPKTKSDPFRLGGREFQSRLIVGTGKYATMELMAEAIEASGAEIVTVAVRRTSVADPNQPKLFDFVDRNKYLILPNTAGCYTAEEAVRYARLAREVGISDWIKLEVIGDQRTLFPDTSETLKAAEILLKDGFTVLPYIGDDPVACRRLEDMGCAAVMPLAAPIGSGLGIRNPANLMIIREFAKIPLIVDAGVGTASDAALAMELGADAVLMNTGIAGAKDAVSMATAMNYAVRAGRLAYLSGRIERKLYATASSPMTGMIE